MSFKKRNTIFTKQKSKNEVIKKCCYQILSQWGDILFKGAVSFCCSCIFTNVFLPSFVTCFLMNLTWKCRCMKIGVSPNRNAPSKTISIHYMPIIAILQQNSLCNHTFGPPWDTRFAYNITLTFSCTDF